MSVNVYSRETNSLIKLASENDLTAYTTEGQVVNTSIVASSWEGFMQLLAAGLSDGTYGSNIFVEAIVSTTSVYGFVIAESSTVVRFITSVCARIYDTETSTLVTTTNLHGLPFITSTTDTPAGVFLLNGEAIYFKDSSGNTCTVDAKTRAWQNVSTTVMATMKSNPSAYSGAFYNDTDGYYLFADSTYYKLNQRVADATITVTLSSTDAVLEYKDGHNAVTNTSIPKAGIYRDYITSLKGYNSCGTGPVPCGVLSNTSSVDDGYSPFDYIFNYPAFNRAYGAYCAATDSPTMPSSASAWKTWIETYMMVTGWNPTASASVQLYSSLGIERLLGNTTMSLADSWFNFKEKLTAIGWTSSVKWAQYMRAWLQIFNTNDSSSLTYTIADSSMTTQTVYGVLAKPSGMRKTLFHTDASNYKTWNLNPVVSKSAWYTYYEFATYLGLADMLFNSTYAIPAYTELNNFRQCDVYKGKNNVWFFFKVLSALILAYTYGTNRVTITPRIHYLGGLEGTVTVSNAASFSSSSYTSGSVPTSVNFKVTPSGIYTEDSNGNDVCVVPKVQDKWSRRESVSIAVEGLPHGTTFGVNATKGLDTTANPAYKPSFDDDSYYVYAHTVDGSGTPTFGSSTEVAEDTPFATADKNAEMKGFPVASEVQLGTRKIDVALPLASKYSDIGDGSCTVPLTLGNFARLLFGNKYNKTATDFGGHLNTGSTDKYLSRDSHAAAEFANDDICSNIPLDSQIEISEESGWANMGLFDISSRYVSDYLSIAGIGNPNNVDVSIEATDMTPATLRHQRQTGCNAVQYYDGVKKNSRNRFKLGSTDYVSDDTTVGVAYTANALDFPVTGCMSLRTHIPLHSREQSAANLPYIPGYCYPFGGNAACGYSSGNCDDKLYVEPTATDGVGFNSNDVRQFPMHKSECGNSSNYTAGGHGKTMIPVFGRMLTLMSCVAQQVTMINYNGEWTGTRSPFISGYFWSAMASSPAFGATTQADENSYYGYDANASAAGKAFGNSQYLATALWNCKINMCGMFPHYSSTAANNNREITRDAFDSQGGPGMDNDSYGFYNKILGTGCVYHPGYRLVQHTPGIDCGMYTGIVSGIKLGCAQFRQYQNNSTNHADNVRPLGQQFQPNLGAAVDAKSFRLDYNTTPATNGLAGWGYGAPNILTDTTSTLSYVPGSGVNWKLEFQSWGLNDLKPYGVAKVDANILSSTNYYIHDDAYSPSSSDKSQMYSKLYDTHFNEYGDTANALRSGTWADGSDSMQAYTYSTLADVFTFSFPTGMPEFGLSNTHSIATWGPSQSFSKDGLSNVVTARVRIFNCYGKIVSLTQDVFKYGGEQYGLAGYASVTGQQFNLSTVEPFAITVLLSDAANKPSADSAYADRPIRLPANNVQVHWYNNVNSMARTWTDAYPVLRENYMGRLIDRPSDLYCDIDIHVDYQYTAMLASLWSTTIDNVNGLIAARYYEPKVAVYNTDGLAYAESATATGLRYIYSGKYMYDTADNTNLYAIRSRLASIQFTTPSVASNGNSQVGPLDSLQYLGIHASEQILDGFSNYIAFPEYVYDDVNNLLYTVTCVRDISMRYESAKNRATTGGFWSIPGPSRLSTSPYGEFTQGTFILAYNCRDHSQCKVFRVLKNLTTSDARQIYCHASNYDPDNYTTVQLQNSGTGWSSGTNQPQGTYQLATVCYRYELLGNFQEIVAGDVDRGAPVEVYFGNQYENTLGSTEDQEYLASYTDSE